jgi:hypothetical protein
MGEGAPDKTPDVQVRERREGGKKGGKEERERVGST